MTIKFIKLLAVIILIAISSNVMAKDDDYNFYDFDLLRETGTLVTLLDWKQTLKIKDTEGINEIVIQKIIGTNPDRSNVNEYFIAKIAAHYAINYALQDYPAARAIWNAQFLYISYDVVTNNLKLGLDLNW